MNTIPPFALRLISFFMGAPAAAARFLGVTFTFVEGTFVLSGMNQTMAPFSPHGLPFGGHAGLAVAAFALSILGYLMEALLAYITAENRQALPPRKVAVLMVAELGIQSLGLAAVCLLAAATLREAGLDHYNRYFGIAGAVAAVATGFLFFRFNRQILAWRQAWQRPATDPPEGGGEGGDARS
jgi:hypothetical protein